MERRLRFSDHTARSAPDEEHYREVALVAAEIRCKLPPDWKQPP